MHDDSGFTLIELMIVIAVMGILVGISAPAYQKYRIKAQLAQAFTIADTFQQKAILYYALHGSIPCCSVGTGDFQDVNNPAPNVYMLRWYALSATQGRVEVWFDTNLPIFAQLDTGAGGGGVIVVFTIDQSALAKGQIAWNCGPHPYRSYPTLLPYLPSTCQSYNSLDYW